MVSIDNRQYFYSKMLGLPAVDNFTSRKETSRVAEGGAYGVHLFRRDH